MSTLILGSGSPRRQSLLRQAGVSFEIEIPDVDETVIGSESAEDYVCRLSLSKAQVVSGKHSGSIVLAADTTVVHQGRILGKPESKTDGMAMLRSLSASVHKVLTGVSVVSGELQETFYVASLVTFRSLSIEEIEWYWETGEPADKAGGYGLQGAGAAFVTSIDGSYSNVIGLPLAETILILRRFGVECLGSVIRQDFIQVQGSSNG